MDLPKTLHGQLYLLAYDPYRRRYELKQLWLLGFALRAAMLTDLYLSGYLHDAHGLARPAGAARPADPMLRSMFEMVGDGEPRTWPWLVAAEQEHAPRLVREHLEDRGWLCQVRYRRLGLFPTTRTRPFDEELTAGLVDRASTALEDAGAGRTTDPRSLALGRIASLGLLTSVYYAESHALAVAAVADLAIPPISGLEAAISEVRAATSAVGGCGGCGGGGCGGCGGCGG